MQRYARHFDLAGVGFQGQLKLREAKVLVVGAGGLGSPAL
ncbi:MAG TPA: ThiF family adenylyltransferase, partial [Fibrobacteria bacterium]|nr:ThiF family adenylyltransferase [Fibrobacteria bacterium]